MQPTKGLTLMRKKNPSTVLCSVLQYCNILNQVWINIVYPLNFVNGVGLSAAAAFVSPSFAKHEHANHC